MKKWDVVLLSFPFTDLSSSKVRPALVISPTSMNKKLQDAVFMLITSKPDRIHPFDVLVDSEHKEFGATGLLKGSVIRINKMITLTKSMVRTTLGRLGPELQKDVTSRIRNYFEV